MKYLYAFILIIYINPYLLYSQNQLEQLSPSIEYYNQLLQNKDYYRSYLELQRIKIFYPSTMTQSQYHVTESYLLFKGKQCNSLEKNNNISVFYRCDAFFLEKKYNMAQAILSCYTYNEKDLFKYYADRRACAALLVLDYTNGEKWMHYGRHNSLFIKEILSISNTYDSLKRSPLAALFLGLFPGAGYLYGSGDWGTALATFFVVSLLVGATVAGILTGNIVLASISGSAAVFFYGGSMIGAYMAAERFNMENDNKKQSYIFSSFRLDLQRETINNRYGVNFSGK